MSKLMQSMNERMNSLIWLINFVISETRVKRISLRFDGATAENVCVACVGSFSGLFTAIICTLFVIIG